jgi:hypothetical protein
MANTAWGHFFAWYFESTAKHAPSTWVLIRRSQVEFRRFLISTGRDQVIRFWDVTSGSDP